MELPADFFAEFPAVSKADWLARIAKDLKGKPLAELYWQIDSELQIDPFGHADDFPVPPVPLATGVNDWEISEDVTPADPGAANAQALEALEFGAMGLRFWLTTPATVGDLRERLNGIYLDLISLHFAGPGLAQNPGAVFAALETLNPGKTGSGALQGSFAWDLAAAPGLQDWRYLADLMEYAQQHFPKFRLITVDGTTEFQGSGHVADELAALLRRGNFYLKKLSERGIPPAAVAAQLQFSVAVGRSYFLEIAKLRAFRLLWANVLQGWGIPLDAPQVEARFAPAAYDDDLYTNLVRATTLSMSAVLGGAQRLVVAPYDSGREQAAAYPPAFGRRMARNVQHLLKMESFLAEASDPAAGSYYVEKITAQLAAAAWAKFQAG